jgi:hypothetical protein
MPKPIGDRMISCNIEYGNDIIKKNFSSRSTIKEIKAILKRQLIKENPDIHLIRLFYNGKELKTETASLGSICEGEEVNLLMADIIITEDLIKDQKKVDEVLITNLTRFCEIHKEERALSVCITCSNSICQLCEAEHKDHKIVKKNEVIMFENNLKDTYQQVLSKMHEMGLETKYTDFYKNFRHDLSKQCEELMTMAEQIKKKEVNIMNSFKLNFDSLFPSLLDFKDKLDELITEVSENKREKILRNDKDFVEFYHKYSQLTSLNDKTFDSLDSLKIKLEKYRDIVHEFKTLTQNILNFINDQFDRMKDYQLTEDAGGYITGQTYNMGNYNTMGGRETMGQVESPSMMARRHAKEPEPSSGKLNLINLMSPQKGKNLLKHMDPKKPGKEFSRSDVLMRDIRKSNKTSNTDNNIHYFNSNNRGSLEHNADGPAERISNLNLNQHNLNGNSEIHNGNESSHIYIPNKILNIEVFKKSIFIYNVETKIIEKLETDLANTKIKRYESYHSTLNYKEKFYIGGGYSNPKMFYEYDISKNEFKKLKDMITGHSYHCLLGIANEIFAISGFKSKKAEKYEISNDSWSSLPDVNISRSWPSCVFVNDRYIYIFGGLNEPETTACKTIEKLDLSLCKTWEIVNAAQMQNESYFIPCYSGLLQLPDCILLFGGKVNTSELNTNKCWKYNFSDHSLTEQENLQLPSKDEYDGRPFLPMNSSLTLFGQFSSVYPNKFYIYDKDSNTIQLTEFQ